MREFTGQFTSLHEQTEMEIYVDVVSILVKALEYGLGDNYNLDYMVNAHHKFIVVLQDKLPAMTIKMTSCEKIIVENLFDQERLEQELDMTAEEMNAILKQYPHLKATEPVKRVHRYTVELEQKSDCEPIFQTVLGILMEIE